GDFLMFSAKWSMPYQYCFMLITQQPGAVQNSDSRGMSLSWSGGPVKDMDCVGLNMGYRISCTNPMLIDFIISHHVLSTSETGHVHLFLCPVKWFFVRPRILAVYGGDHVDGVLDDSA